MGPQDNKAFLSIYRGEADVDLSQPPYDLAANNPCLEGVVNPPACIHLSVVSNSRLLCDGIIAILSGYGQIEPASGCADELPTQSVAAKAVSHMVLLDGTIGPTVTLQWIRWWRRQLPSPHILVLELANDPELIIACIEAGAGGYTLRGASGADVVEAIKRVWKGMADCSPEVVARLFARLAEHGTGAGTSMATVAAAALTPRELEVLRYIVQNRTNSEIAALLVIEVRTVKHHVHNILEKLRLRHRWDAARFAAEQGWFAEDMPTDAGEIC